MFEDTRIAKGSWVRARWLEATPASLAGAQPKTGAVRREVAGVVTHIRGDRPVEPTRVRLWVRPDGGGEDVVVDPQHLVEHRPASKEP